MPQTHKMKVFLFFKLDRKCYRQYSFKIPLQQEWESTSVPASFFVVDRLGAPQLPDGRE